MWDNYCCGQAKNNTWWYMRIGNGSCSVPKVYEQHVVEPEAYIFATQCVILTLVGSGEQVLLVQDSAADAARSMKRI